MTNKSGLPPTKRIRVSNDSSQAPTATKATDYDSGNTSNEIIDVFEWDDNKIELLIFGTVRDNIHFGIRDISSIIFHYLKDMFVNYHINNDKRYDCINYWSQQFCTLNTGDNDYSVTPMTANNVDMALTYVSESTGSSWSTAIEYFAIYQQYFVTYEQWDGLTNWTFPDPIGAYYVNMSDIYWSFGSGGIAEYEIVTDLDDICTDYLMVANNTWSYGAAIYYANEVNYSGYDDVSDALDSIRPTENIEADIYANQLQWGTTISRASQYVSKCEPKQAEDTGVVEEYCYYDLSTIFNVEDVITPNTEDYDHYEVFVQLDDNEKDLYEGDCGKYWEDRCNDEIVKDWCSTIYAPPYQCERTVQRSVTDIAAVSFALTELVLTALLLVIAVFAKRICVCCCNVDESQAEMTKLMGKYEDRIARLEAILAQQQQYNETPGQMPGAATAGGPGYVNPPGYNGSNGSFGGVNGVNGVTGVAGGNYGMPGYNNNMDGHIHGTQSPIHSSSVQMSGMY